MSTSMLDEREMTSEVQDGKEDLGGKWRGWTDRIDDGRTHERLR